MALVKLPKALNDPHWRSGSASKSLLIQDHLHFSYRIEVSFSPYQSSSTSLLILKPSSTISFTLPLSWI